MTDAEELSQVEDAIAAILARGQSGSIRDNSVTRADLAQLQRRRDQLTARIARAARGGIRVRGATPV